ncbi:hypothetical protein Bhyg_11016, partial [Pseudolycoriella hygida]
MDTCTSPFNTKILDNDNCNDVDMSFEWCQYEFPFNITDRTNRKKVEKNSPTTHCNVLFITDALNLEFIFEYFEIFKEI